MPPQPEAFGRPEREDEFMVRLLLVVLVLLTTAGPALAQGSSLMVKGEFKAFVSKLHQDSQRWASLLSSIDVASIEPSPKVAEKRKQTCLKALDSLQEQVTELEKKNSLRNQLAVLNGLTNASACLGAFQDVLAFQDALGPGLTKDVAKFQKWEDWETDLTHAFEESEDDDTRMYVHMDALGQIVDSKIDAGTLTKSDLKSASKSQ
jgi:hypothetical protein